MDVFGPRPGHRNCVSHRMASVDHTCGSEKRMDGVVVARDTRIHIRRCENDGYVVVGENSEN